MKISANKTEKLYVYKKGETEPWGICGGFVTSGGKVDRMCVKTLSLIPICKSVKLSDTEKVGKRIVLRSGAELAAVSENAVIRTRQRVAERAEKGRIRCGKLKDMSFDSETGRIYEVEVSGAAILKNQKISINKIEVRDNTIYIERTGGENDV